MRQQQQLPNRQNQGRKSYRLHKVLVRELRGVMYLSMSITTILVVQGPDPRCWLMSTAWVPACLGHIECIQIQCGKVKSNK